MKTKCMRQLLATLLITLPVLSWQDGKKHDDWKRDDKRKISCPILKPVCPLFNGSNGFEVTDPGDDENSPTLRRAINQANASDATKCNPFVIVFDLDLNNDGVTIITITQDLPKIKKPVCINGFTNNEASEEQRDITVVVAHCTDDATNGLVFAPTACGSTVKGLSIVGFNNNEASAIVMRASCSLIAGNDIGNIDDSEIACNGFEGISKQNFYGITVEAAECVTIGGLCPNERNVISGNNDTGLRILGNKVTAVGNYIGTDLWGILSRPNETGITIDGNCNTIGCKELCGSNLISANNQHGIEINGSYNKVVNSIIGLDRFGKHDLGNRFDGVSISGTYNTVVQSTISANGDTNIRITGSFNAVLCSIIGTDPKGKKAFYSERGINLGAENIEGSKTTDTLIKNNLITVRSGTGIRIKSASSTVIQGNRIGGNCSDSCSLGQSTGILITSEPCFDGNGGARRAQTRAEVVTGTCQRPCGACDIDPGCCPGLPLPTEAVGTCIRKNIILGNVDSGITVDTSVRFTKIEENFIGVNKKCCFVGNGYGIFIEKGAQNNSVHRNIIAGNQFNGVGVVGSAISDTSNVGETRNNSLTKNAIFGNCGSGIRLFAGGNDCLGAPLITEAVVCDEHLDVTIDATSLPQNVPFTIELYGNKNCRKCISEGQIFLCCKTVKEPLEDDLKLRVELSCPELKFVTATVTQLTSCFAEGNTSEFSCPVKIIPCPPAPAEELAETDTREIEKVAAEESEEVRQIKSKLAQLGLDY